MINYGRLWEAKQFYEEEDYQYIEVPWTCPREFTDITLPPGKKTWEVDGETLLGSAEQSFLSLANRGLKGRYMSITPCFRDEAVYDDLHKPYFMKLELFDNSDDDIRAELQWMIIKASDFFESVFGSCCSVHSIKTGENSYDLIDSEFGIELGSYGLGSHPLVGSWLYGTALAEPRTSYVKEKLEKHWEEQRNRKKPKLFGVF